MTTSLSPKIIDILQSLPPEEKIQIIHLLSDGATGNVSAQNSEDKLTVAAFSAMMREKNLAKGKSLTVEEMNESIVKMFAG